MLNNKKQIAVGNATGIILLPYKSGALYRYPINKTEAASKTANESVPLIYLTVFEVFGLSPQIPIQVKINKNEFIGDIRPMGTFRNSSGFLRKISSTSHEKLNIWSRVIIRQYIATINNDSKTIDWAMCDFAEYIFERDRMLKIIKIVIVEGAEGM